MDDITFRTALKIRLGVDYGDLQRSSVDEHADHFNCHLFTAEKKESHDAIVHEVHSLSQHAAKSISFPKYGDLRTPTGDDGRQIFSTVPND